MQLVGAHSAGSLAWARAAVLQGGPATLPWRERNLCTVRRLTPKSRGHLFTFSDSLKHKASTIDRGPGILVWAVQTDLLPETDACNTSLSDRNHVDNLFSIYT
jgi:hypothetical protein